MNGQLADRVAAYLADGREATVPELARVVRVRDADVRKILRDDPRFACRSVPRERSTRARLWVLVLDSSHSSPALNGRDRASEPSPSFGASGGVSAPPSPRSVGEAIRAANRRRAA